MRSHPFLCVLPVVAMAGIAMTAGCSSTAAKRPTSSNTATTTISVGGGNVRLISYTDNDGPTSTVILAGAVGDYGEAESVNPDGTVNTEHNSQLSLMLARGSFRLDIAELDKRFVAAMANLPVDTRTCSGTASVSGPVPIVAGSGTGSYKGISGTFTLTITLDEVYRLSACSETSALLAQIIIITGSGTVAFG